MAMGRTQWVQHVFIVRIWQEPAAEGQPSPWRGSVEQVPSAERRYFSQLPDLQQFIVRWLGRTTPPSPDADGSGEVG